MAQGTIVSYRDDGTGRVRLNTLAKVDPKRGLRMTVAELAGYAGCPPRPISMLVLLRAVGEREREREREGGRERERARERVWVTSMTDAELVGCAGYPLNPCPFRVGYRVTSLKRNSAPLGPYSRTMPRALGKVVTELVGYAGYPLHPSHSFFFFITLQPRVE